MDKGDEQRECRKPLEAALRYTLVVAGLTIAYVLLAKLSLLHAFARGNAAPVWPPTGLSLAVLLLWGRRYWPFVGLGALLTVLDSAAGPLAATAIALGNTLEALLGATWLRSVGFDNSLRRVRDVLNLMGIGAAVSTAVSATIGVAALCGLGRGPEQWSDFQAIWLVWWSGNAMGNLVVAPLILVWGTGQFIRPRLSRLVEGAWVFAALLLACLVGFSHLISPDHATPALAFPVFLPLTWAALRFDQRGATAASFLVALIAVVTTSRGMGPFAMPGHAIAESLAWMGTFIAATSATSLFISAALSERERAARERLESEQKLSGIMQQAADGIFLADDAGRFLDANPAGCAMLGYMADELRSRSIADVVVVDADDPVPIRYDELRAGRTLVVERRMRRRDGSLLPVEISSRMLPDGRFLGIVRDISDRKHADEHRQLMLSELDHRVKNNLSLVLSIADQTMRTSESLADFYKSFSARIMALSRVHGLLAQNRWAGADLQSVAMHTLQPFAERHEGRLVISGPPTTLPARAASPLCMALHELATNAAKYGALSGPLGRVDVTWDTGADARGRPEVRLSWTERGGPPVQPPARTSFGTQLIEGGIAHELHGRVALNFHPGGVRCEIVAPLVAEVEQV
jgi:PAS domain S-box-containing protein